MKHDPLRNEMLPTQQALAAREREFRSLAENCPDQIIRYDTSLRCVYMNPRAEQVLARQYPHTHDTTGAVAESGAPLVHLRDYFKRLEQVAAGGTPQTFQMNVPTPDGAVQVHEIRMIAERDEQGHIASLLTIGRDITPLAHSQAALKELQEQLHAVIDHNPDLIWLKDPQGRYLLCNPSFEEFAGLKEPQIVGKTDHEIVPEALADIFRANDQRLIGTDGVYRAEEEVTFPSDGRRAVLNTCKVAVRNAQGELLGVMGVSRDITELSRQREHIEHLAYCDSLTGLPNRVRLRELLHQHLEGDAPEPLALILLDVDHFKDVNDTLGHSRGDQLLIAFAERLIGCLDGRATLTRYGGDEFVILLPGPACEVDALVYRLTEACKVPLMLAEDEVYTSCSMGVALYPLHGRQIDSLLAHADTAMYEAKRRGRATWQLYSPELSARAQEKMRLGRALRSALANGELQLYLQPKFSIETEQLLGAEALLRWRHPTLGLLTPDKFIALAEETGLIVEMGRWVIEEACRIATGWNRCRETPLTIAVNISPRQFVPGDLAQQVSAILATQRCKPTWLEIEITEGMLIDDVGLVKDALAALSELGVSIAIDDFGTGHSALGYLRHYPVQVLKIDRSFVTDMEHDARKLSLVRAFLSMAEALGMATVAEGVENRAQADLLRGLGCPIGQGFYYSRPVEQAVFEVRYGLQVSPLSAT